MTSHLPKVVAATWRRWLAEEENDDNDDDEHFGVHIEYTDLYDTILFFIAIYLSGKLAAFVKMPSLVGEIICGILLGPSLADFIPYPESMVLMGELGLVLLVLEAGIDIDVSTLQLIGTRGVLVAIVGSILPIGLGILLSVAVFGTSDIKAAIAAGCSFGPTSLGIALNVLRSGGILNTPVGQLIIGAAVIDDMIALIVLSQLEALTDPSITVVGILIPVISALAYLLIGGYLALFVVPPIINKRVLTKVAEENHGVVEMAIMFAFLIALMPATHYSQASYLMGAFVAGLAFCTSHELHTTFVRQFKRVLQWLMRIFFAASIGFQVPIKDLIKGHILLQGLILSVALTGKLAVGFMVPNFTQARHFTNWHLRDCLITSFSMAAEGEFAFVIAVFSVENGLIDKDQYASVVWAVLLSTIIPPFLLRFTISYYNKKAAQELQNLAEQEMGKEYKLEELEDLEGMTSDERHNKLLEDIQCERAVFLCIQTQSESAWGLMPRIMQKLSAMKLDVIDHRSWHPRGIDATLVNEIYVKDNLRWENRGEAQVALQKRIDEVRDAMKETIGQPETCKVKVQRWFPGVVQDIVESVHDRTKQKNNLSLEQRLVTEAAKQMEMRQSMQTTATKERTVQEILGDMDRDNKDNAVEATMTGGAGGTATLKKRHRRKMRSTPAVAGDLFGSADTDTTSTHPSEEGEATLGGSSKKLSSTFDFGMKGHRAEIIVDGETFDVRLNAQTIKQLRSGFSGDMIDSRGISLSNVSMQTGDITSMLSGYVRNKPMVKIVEEEGDNETTNMSEREE